MLSFFPYFSVKNFIPAPLPNVLTTIKMLKIVSVFKSVNKKLLFSPMIAKIIKKKNIFVTIVAFSFSIFINLERIIGIRISNKIFFKRDAMLTIFDKKTYINKGIKKIDSK